MTPAPVRTLAVILLGDLAQAACGMGELERAHDPVPGEVDDLPGAATIAGIQFLPAVIHAGDRVTLHDPVRPAPGEPAFQYLWTACAGAFEGPAHERQTTWIAPATPGVYAVTVNIVNSRGDDPSRVLPLCVAAGGQEACPEPSGAGPVLTGLTVEPSSFVQASDCAGACQAVVEAVATVPGGDGEPRYVWGAQGGAMEGEGAQVTWHLPELGCCAETFTAAVTACGARNDAAATGFVSVLVVPE